MTPAQRSLLLFGTDEPVAPLRLLAAGAVTADLDRGNLRYIRWGGLEVIRAVAFIVRDTAWGTYAPTLSDLAIEEAEGRFSVTYVARCDGPEGDFEYRASIAGRADGRLAFSATGTSGRGFRTCRTGFVVLHPLEGVVGRPVAVEHASGGRSATIFPALISADQPIFDIRELTHEPCPGVAVRVRMEGDTFEMEDHRNWTDASFKTYVRPLARGYPYSIAAAEQVEQSVSVTVAGAPPEARAGGEHATVTLGQPKGAVPRLGLFVEAGDLAAALSIAPRVAALKPAYLIGRVDCRESNVAFEFRRLAELAAALNCPLALQAIIRGISPESELVPLATAVGRMSALDSILIVPARDLKSRPINTIPAGEAGPEEILAAARICFTNVRVGGGMPVPFAELNRNQPAAGIDFLTHATQGAVHAADDISVMETLTAIPDVIRSARLFAGDVPYRLGPSTIGVPAFTAPSGISPNPTRGRVTMAADDPRQQALFGGAFALGLVAVAAREGIEGLTFAAAAGPAGLFRPDGTSSPSVAVFDEFASLAGMASVETTVEGVDNLAAIAAKTAEGPRLFLANCSGKRVTVRIPDRKFRTVRLMDAEALLANAADRIDYRPIAGNLVELDAYAVAILK